MNPKQTNFETDSTENKLVSQDSLPEDLWEPISGFSNMDGGTIRLGVDKLGNRIGVTQEFVDKLQQDIVSLCNSSFNHKLYPEISIDEDLVINVYIPPVPAALRPIYTPKRGPIKGGRVRVGSVKQQIDEEWLRRFAISARGGAELIEFPVSYEETLDGETIESYIKIISAKRGNVYRGLSTEEILVKLRAIKDNSVTMFGLLAFSNEYSLQELTAPTINVAVTHYSGTAKVNPEDSEEVYLEDKEFSGNVKYPKQGESFLREA